MTSLCHGTLASASASALESVALLTSLEIRRTNKVFETNVRTHGRTDGRTPPGKQYAPGDFLLLCAVYKFILLLLLLFLNLQYSIP